MTLKTCNTGRRVLLIAILSVASAAALRAAAAEKLAQPDPAPSKPGTLLGLLPLELGEPDRHILESEKFRPPRPAGIFGPPAKPDLQVIYFPPNLPPLGVELDLPAVDRRMGAPADLAPYVMEPFYAPLSTRVVKRSLTRRQEEALARYDQRKANLLAALRAKLAATAALPDEARRAELAAFAAAQAPALAALEREADQWRRDCYTRPGGARTADWYEWRGWKLGRGRLARPRGETLFFEYQLLRAAAFYQEGLGLEQRRLLRECAMELEAEVFPGPADQPVSVRDHFWFFSPHLARVHLPDDLPAELQAKIDAFRALKAQLKRELRDTIYEQDRIVFESRREPVLEELAYAQAPRLADLDVQAEEIRRSLARVAPQPTPPAPAALPPELAARIEAYRAEQEALRRELADHMRRAVRHMIVPDAYAANPSMNAWRQARLAAIAQAREEFQRDHADRIAALRQQIHALRMAIEAWAGPGTASASTAGNSSFLAEFFARRGEQQGRHDYHVAVFQPGLSPAQRRLLLDAAIVALNLPLPGPEEQPGTLPGTLLK